MLAEKYDYDKDVAAAFASFLRPMLDLNPKTRATAREALSHPWLTASEHKGGSSPKASPTLSPSCGAQFDTGDTIDTGDTHDDTHGDTGPMT